MLSQGWILLVLAGAVASALGPAPHQTPEESLKSALNAVNRKQRSLDNNSQEYYNNLRSAKYYGGEPERKFEREHQGDRVIDDEGEKIEFLPNEAGQLETVGNGFQSLNNKLLEKALRDYQDSIPEQAEPAPSLFRERERSSSRKRGNDRVNGDNKDMVKFNWAEFMGMDDEDYVDAIHTLCGRYNADQANKYYGANRNPVYLGELLYKDLGLGGQERETNENQFPETDPESVPYLSPAERRNVNGRYPIGREFRNYRSIAKRYPVAKRSPKPLQTKKQMTDPKVAQDLGALFGTQPADGQNHTNHPEHDHKHDHEHDHDHKHDNGDQHNRETSSEPPKVTGLPKGQKENITKVTKAKPIEVRKKSVDWSQYFGIDRRRKKATFMAGEGTQNQDDEWMLQRYYENMAENLNPTEREYQKENTETKDQLEQIDSKLKKIKDLVIHEVMKSANSQNGADLQKVKDKIMAGMVAAYSLEKMRKALSDLRSSAAARLEAQKAANAQSNHTSNFRDNAGLARSEDKRGGNSVDDNPGADESGTCPELRPIEDLCRSAGNLVGDDFQMSYRFCLRLQICKACMQPDLGDKCFDHYAVEASKLCDAQETRGDQQGRELCAKAVLILSQLLPPAASALECRMNGDSCLRRYSFRPRFYGYPYPAHRFNLGHDFTAPQQSDR